MTGTAPSELPAGLAVGRYVVLGKLGEGGMGVVYRAQHPDLPHVQVAIKVMAARFAAEPHLVARFHAEAQAASRVGHPNIISVLDCGHLPDGRPYLVMELLTGEGLDKLLKQVGGVLGPALGRRIFDQLCLGLAAAHQANIVHRDLKPENIFVVRPRHRDESELYVKILDFGIAKPLDAANLTRTGDTVGTPYYMAPEQWKSQAIDRRTDIYALGAMLYECFTGVRPFAGTTAADLLVQHLMEQPRPPVEHGLANPALARLILDCLSKDPAGRPATVGEVRARLLAALGEGAEEIRAPAPALGRTAGAATGDFAGQAIEAERVPPRRRWLAPVMAGGVGLLALVGIASAIRDARAPAPSAMTGAAIVPRVSTAAPAVTPAAIPDAAAAAAPVAAPTPPARARRQMRPVAESPVAPAPRARTPSEEMELIPTMTPGKGAARAP